MAAGQAAAEPAYPSSFGADGVTLADKLETEIRGRELRIQFQGTDQHGKHIEHVVKCYEGNDVAWVKGQLAKAIDYPYGQISLWLDNKLMFDPLSLNDFP